MFLQWLPPWSLYSPIYLASLTSSDSLSGIPAPATLAPPLSHSFTAARGSGSAYSPPWHTPLHSSLSALPPSFAQISSSGEAHTDHPGRFWNLPSPFHVLPVPLLTFSCFLQLLPVTQRIIYLWCFFMSLLQSQRRSYQMFIKTQGEGDRQIWVQILPLPYIPCMFCVSYLTSQRLRFLIYKVVIIHSLGDYSVSTSTVHGTGDSEGECERPNPCYETVKRMKCTYMYLIPVRELAIYWCLLNTALF